MFSFLARVFVFISIFSFAAEAGEPSLAVYSSEESNIFWFVFFADSHIGEQIAGGDQDTELLNWVTGEGYDIIKPTVILAGGDLVDGTNGGVIPDGQHQEEWEDYEKILYFNWMTPDIYYDVPGNHDHYSDGEFKFYKKYSVQGKYTGNTQNSVSILFPFGKYHFVGVNTAADDGLPWPMDNAGLNEEEIKYLEEELEKNKDASLTFVYGHHPIDNLQKGKEKFLELLKLHKVSAYLYGHTHGYSINAVDSTLHFNVRSLGKSPDKHLGIVAVDNNSVSMRAFTAKDFPYVIITAPADKNLGGGNLAAYIASNGWQENPVRALVFDSSAVSKVEFRIDNGGWHAMVQSNKYQWIGSFDGTSVEKGAHTLEVRAISQKEASHKITFVIDETQCANELDDDNNGLVDYPYDGGCLSPADNDESGGAPATEESFEETAVESLFEEFQGDEFSYGYEIEGETAEVLDVHEPGDAVSEGFYTDTLQTDGDYTEETAAESEIIHEYTLQDAEPYEIIYPDRSSSCGCRINSRGEFPFGVLMSLLLLLLVKIKGRVKLSD